MLGLAAYSTIQRTSEIGIRKVLGAAVLITFLTVGFHSIKAAVADPVDSLRTE